MSPSIERLFKFALSFQVRVHVPNENQAVNDNLFKEKSKLSHRVMWAALQRGEVVQLTVDVKSEEIHCPHGMCTVPKELLTYVEMVQNDY